MRHFLIQDRVLLPDFCYEALRGAEYANWLDPGSVRVDRIHSVEVLSEVPPSVIPIGSLEFVFAVAGIQMGKPLVAHPLNVPQVLAIPKFSARKIWRNVSAYCVPEDVPSTLFAKSATRYKGFSDIIFKHQLPEIFEKETVLDLSEKVEFDDEWRVFVHAGKIVGMHCYSGLFSCVPTKEFIGAAMEEIHRSDPALFSYTLDVGFIEGQEAVVEVHPFVSCGLYGFRDYRCLLSMFENGYLYIKSSHF